MISIPDPDAPFSAGAFGGALVRGVPRSYAVLFFSANPTLGWFLLGVSLLAPDLGLAGLAGVCATAAFAWVLGMERENIRNGYLLFNSLLVSLTLGWMHRAYHFSPEVYAVLFLAAVTGTLFLAASLQHWFAVNLGMSAHSLPAVLAGYVLYFLGYAMAGPLVPAPLEVHPWLSGDFLPPFWQALFQAFGAMLFQSQVLAGILVFLGLAWASPLTALLAAAAFSTGAGVMHLLGYQLSPEGVTWCGFNFLLCGIALGSGYFAVSRASLLLALCGAFLCALVTLALSTALRYFSLPASALPYNLIVLVMVYALKQRRMIAGLYPSPAPGALPEDAARQVLINTRRFPHFGAPALALPFTGLRIISQGMNGALTHRGPWRYALDFEAETEPGAIRDEGAVLEDFPAYNSPVLAPCPGVIAAVVNEVPDNPPGANNPERNWGNYVVIFSDAGYYVMLAHLKQGSVPAWIGQRVATGQQVGLCGNSGRSPVPHLHLQIQDTLHAGAPTRWFCLTNYIEQSPDAQSVVHRTSGVPAAGTRVSSVTPRPEVAACLGSWLPGEYRYRLTGDEHRTWEETVVVDFDEIGRFRLRSRRHQAKLTGFLSGNVFFATDFRGPGESVLAFLAVGLARVPCISDPGVTWEDLVSTVPFHGVALRCVHNVLDPFAGPSVIGYTYGFVAETIRPDDPSFAVRCELKGGDALGADLPAQTPRGMTVHMAPRRGAVLIETRFWKDQQVRAECVDWQPLK